MTIINTVADIQATKASPDHKAFLQALLNDYVTFDDAEYPENYDHSLKEGDDGFIASVLRKEWNAGAAAAWGFDSREAIEDALN